MRAALGLGGNLEHTERLLRAAVAALRPVLAGLVVAPLYRSRPVGGPPQPPYLNSAVVGRPRLPPEELMAFAKALERAAGRHRGGRHGPRPLDIDLLLYGERTSSRPELTLPHPELRRRRFALAPLAAICGDLRVPPGGETVAELLAQVGQRDQVERVGWHRAP